MSSLHTGQISELYTFIEDTPSCPGVAIALRKSQ